MTVSTPIPCRYGLTSPERSVRVLEVLDRQVSPDLADPLLRAARRGRHGEHPGPGTVLVREPDRNVRIVSDRPMRLVEDDQRKSGEGERSVREVVRDDLGGRDDDLGGMEQVHASLGGDRPGERDRVGGEDRTADARGVLDDQGAGRSHQEDRLGRGATQVLGDNAQRDRGLAEACGEHDEGVAVEGGSGDGRLILALLEHPRSDSRVFDGRHRRGAPIGRAATAL